MWSSPQETADVLTFTEKILTGKLHFLCSVPNAYDVKVLVIKLFIMLFLDKGTN